MTPKIYNGGRWTKAKLINTIRNSLRKISMYWRTGDDYLETIRGLNTGPGRHKFIYPCEHCKGWFKRDEVELDHKVPCGKFVDLEDLPGFISRLFVEKDGWNCLCKQCHLVKTLNEKGTRGE